MYTVQANYRFSPNLAQAIKEYSHLVKQPINKLIIAILDNHFDNVVKDIENGQKTTDKEYKKAYAFLDAYDKRKEER